MKPHFAKTGYISPIGHFLIYSIRKPKIQLEKAMLIVSTDIDVGNPKLALINKGKRDRDVHLSLSEYHIGKVEELSIPMFVKLFDNFGIPMSLAVRGQFTEIGGKVFDAIFSSKIKHDIGAHGYYHRMFTNLSHEEADDELNKIDSGMRKYGLVPKTFIFPRNRVAHLDLLERHKYLCYRSRGGLLKDRMQIEKSGSLYDVRPSIYVDEYSNPQLLKSILDIAIRQRVPFHIWFHFWNFGENESAISETLRSLFTPVLSYAREKHDAGFLTFETMFSAAQKMQTMNS